MWVDRPGVGAFPFFQIRVLGLMNRASVWATMEGHEQGTDPIALLGWRMEYLAQFYIPISIYVLFSHDCTCDPMHSVCTGGDIWLGLEMVSCLVRMTLLMLF